MTAKPYIIVVGVDYSDVSRLALREALQTASDRAGSEVHVIHVETDTQLSAGPGTDGEVAPEGTLHRLSAADGFSEALQRLHHVVTEEVTAFRDSLHDAAETAIRVVSHVRTNAPSREIAQIAADLEADLVVVGTKGRSGLALVLLGSVAHAVVTLAPCPVLVVRAKHASLVPSIEPPCPRCLEARKQSGGSTLWCEQHRAHHGQRHTYHQTDRVGQETNFPLVFDER
jgi:nucleotide-binding universal stress UspA family protein